MVCFVVGCCLICVCGVFVGRCSIGVHFAFLLNAVRFVFIVFLYDVVEHVFLVCRSLVMLDVCRWCGFVGCCLMCVCRLFLLDVVL